MFGGTRRCANIVRRTVDAELERIAVIFCNRMSFLADLFCNVVCVRVMTLPARCRVHSPAIALSIAFCSTASMMIVGATSIICGCTLPSHVLCKLQESAAVQVATMTKQRFDNVADGDRIASGEGCAVFGAP